MGPILSDCINTEMNVKLIKLYSLFYTVTPYIVDTAILVGLIDRYF